MLGAYFGSTKIIQGAGGLGQDGPLQAYADGVVGGNAPSAEMPGPLQAFTDGSLGSLGADDAEGPTPISVYNNGVLGPHYDHLTSYGPLQSFHDGSLGQDGPLQAYADGVVGGNAQSADMPGPLQAYSDGSLGDTAPVAVAPVLDLGDAAAISEVKMLLAYSSGGYALSSEGQKTYTQDFYTSGIWEPSASALWQYVLSAVPAFSGKVVSGSAGNQTYPNGLAIGYLYGLLAAPTASAMGPDAASKMFPTISAWFMGKGTDVAPPYLSIADKTKGVRGTVQAGMGMSTMTKWGLGAVALLGIALVLRKKR